MSALPWLTLATIIWLQAIAGTNTDFPAYSSELKSRLHITQFKLNNLAVASDAGKLLGWCAGLAAINLPLPSVPAIGAALGAAGYGIQYLFFIHTIPSLSYTQFFLLNMLNGNSICWLNVTGYRSVMRQFLNKDHGAVIALTTSYTGLTANIYLALANVVAGRNNAAKDKSIYLLLNAVAPVVVGLVVVPTVAVMREKPGDVKAGLVMMFVVAGATGAYVVVETMLSGLRDSPRVWPAGVLLGMVAVVIVVPVWKMGRWVARSEEEEEKEVGDVEEGVVVGEVVVEDNVREVWELVRRVNFWVYFMVYLCGATLGLVFGNNLGQISESRGVSDTILLSIYSSFGFFGRLATAPLSSFSRSKYKVSNTGAIAVLMVFMSVSFFLPLFPSKAPLFVSTAIIGLGSGAISSIAVSVSSELFGQEKFSVNHNIVISNIPIGSFLFGSIAALIYDKGGVEGGRRDRLCMGMECYNITFIIWGCICSFGTILSFVLHSRTRKKIVSFHR